MRPVQNSTFSRPRATSPIASGTVLPCSDVMMRASSSERVAMISRKRKSTCWRFARPVSRHAGCAFFAAFAASWTNSADANATSAVCAPVAGLKTAPRRPSGVRRSPATTCGMVRRLSAAASGAFSIVGVLMMLLVVRVGMPRPRP